VLETTKVKVTYTENRCSPGFDSKSLQFEFEGKSPMLNSSDKFFN